MTSPKQEKQEPYVVDSLKRALFVLDEVAERGHAVTLAEIVREAALPKSTVYRYLRTFVASGYLTYDSETDTYDVGARFLTVARAAEVLERLRRAARPEIERIANLFGRTVNLGVLERGSVVYLDMVETRQYPEVKARIGTRHPVHATALGKAILAYLPEEQLSHWLDQPLGEQTIRTITDRAKLGRELDLVASRGYAIDTEENEDGAMCAGVPIISRTGYPIAAISLTTLTRPRSAVPLETVIDELIQSAAAVSLAFDRSPWLNYLRLRAGASAATTAE